MKQTKQNEENLPVEVKSGSVSTMAKRELTVEQVIDQQGKLLQVIDKCLKDGIHYGKIEGCGNKPTLLKAGAEKLAMIFRLYSEYEVERIELPLNHVEYVVTCTLKRIGTDEIWAQGLGSATSMESKHRFRAAKRICPICKTENIIKGKVEYGGGWLCYAKKGGCGAKWKDGDRTIEDQAIGQEENKNPFDVFNTVLKMAKKRSFTDACLSATAASDIFTQDLEDLDDNQKAAADVPIEPKQTPTGNGNKTAPGSKTVDTSRPSPDFSKPPTPMETFKFNYVGLVGKANQVKTPEDVSECYGTIKDCFDEGWITESERTRAEGILKTVATARKIPIK
jgi:hypothetical protein